MIYVAAAGIEPSESIGPDHFERLVDLIRGHTVHGQFLLLAIDKHYSPEGTVDERRTSQYVPNERVAELARREPDLFVPVISVHPYRVDALDALERWAGEGCRHVKWIPAAMGIDLSDPRVEPFYRKMHELETSRIHHEDGAKGTRGNL